MTIYGVATVAWNWMARVYQSRAWPGWLKVISHALVLLPLSVTLCVVFTGRAPVRLQVVVFSIFAVYFLVLKPLNEKPERVAAP